MKALAQRVKKELFLKSLIFPILTLFVYLWTKNSFTSPFIIQLLAAVVFGYLLYYFVVARGSPFYQRNRSLIVTSFISFLTLLFIALTGWYYSPFFFLLYFLALALGFIFHPVVSVSFVAILVILFARNVGETDVGLDLLTLTSLILVVPVALFLTRQYLRIKQQQKEIAILKKREKVYKSELEKIRDDIVLWNDFQIRGPISTIKHYASHLLKKHPAQKDQDKYLERIAESSENALVLMKNFEEELRKKAFVLPREETETPEET